MSLFVHNILPLWSTIWFWAKINFYMQCYDHCFSAGLCYHYNYIYIASWLWFSDHFRIVFNIAVYFNIRLFNVSPGSRGFHEMNMTLFQKPRFTFQMTSRISLYFLKLWGPIVEFAKQIMKAGSGMSFIYLCLSFHF